MMMESKMAGGQPWPNMYDEADAATRRIYQLGALQTAFLLRATDFDGIPNEHVDIIADFIESTVRHQFYPRVWALPDWWVDRK